MFCKFDRLLSLEDNSTYCYPCDFMSPKNWEIIQKQGLHGIHEVLILSNTLNEENETGEKVFLYQMGPEAKISDAIAHDTWEQVVIIEGELAWLNQDEIHSVQCLIEKGGYVNRPPHIMHGPFRAGSKGCLMFVRLYY